MIVLPKISKPLQILSMAMLLTKKKIIAAAYPTQDFPQYEDFVKKIRRQKERSIYASASELYFAAFFGRDAIEAAEDLLMKDPTFARDLIPLLAAHQGTQYNLITEEEPGRIHHEYRMSPQMYFETTGEELPKKVAAIYERLSKMWGGNEREMTYYGSVDATPLYVKLVANYIELTQDVDILSATYNDKDGREKTIRESVLEAMEWTVGRVEKGPREDVLNIAKPQEAEKRLPLLEYKRSSEYGITNQIWKDSLTSVLHENGQLANNTYPIATIELQGHVYDALMKAAKIFIGDFPDKAISWSGLAKKIQHVVLEKFWLAERGYFAMAIDRDDKGNYRLVKTLTSDQTELLNTGIFDTLSFSQKNTYISGIIQQVYTHDFLTDVGIRCRSLHYDTLVNFWDYHGSRAVWIKATYDFVKGLERQGFYQLAKQLKFRILNGIRVSGSFVELFYVAASGQVAYDPLIKRQTKIHEEIDATTVPEHMQTWTASAVAAIEFSLSLEAFAHRESWKEKMEDDLLRRNPEVTLITSPRKAYKALPKKYSFTINVEKGHQSEENFKKRQQI